MATKRKFKRDYIILEAKDMNFRYKERVLPKAFAKVEINEEKAVVALYVENLKCVKDGYKVVAIQSDYETLDLGNVVLSEQGKGEFVFDLERNDIEIKGIALLHEKQVPLIGFKGNKIENYEEILFAGQDEYEEEFDDELDDLEDTEDIYIDTEDDDDEYEYVDEYPRFRPGRIILGIISLLAFGFCIYKGFVTGLSTSGADVTSAPGMNYVIVALCMLVTALLYFIMNNRDTLFAFLIPMIVYIGSAVFAFLKHGDEFELLILAGVSGVLAVISLILAIASRGGDDYDDEDDYDDPFEEEHDN